eukprot:3180376-Pleurochrysis_carterae.AAC.1
MTQASHDIVKDANTMLVRMAHRGGCGYGTVASTQTPWHLFPTTLASSCWIAVRACSRLSFMHLFMGRVRAGALPSLKGHSPKAASLTCLQV